MVRRQTHQVAVSQRKPILKEVFVLAARSSNLRSGTSAGAREVNNKDARWGERERKGNKY